MEQPLIAVVTGTRAEYGLLRPVLQKLAARPDAKLALLVTGAHLSRRHGATVSEIEADGMPIAARIPILFEEDEGPLATARAVERAIRGFSEWFAENRPACCLVLGDNMFHGAQLEQLLRAAAVRTEGATVFGYPVKNPSAYGVVEFDAQGQVLSIEEKPEKPKSRYAVPGLYFYDGDAAKLAHTLQPSARGELEITALNELYLQQGRLHVELMARGMAWLDTGTPEGMLNAAQYVEAVQSRQGLYIACPEEIAWEQGFISDEEVAARGQELRMTEYGQYLLSLVK